jgi:hypothetical protein
MRFRIGDKVVLNGATILHPFHINKSGKQIFGIVVGTEMSFVFNTIVIRVRWENSDSLYSTLNYFSYQLDLLLPQEKQIIYFL